MSTQLCGIPLFSLFSLPAKSAVPFYKCQTLRDAGIFNAKHVRRLQAYSQELQAEINEEALAILHNIELKDWSRFSKTRQAREKELTDPNDVFIHASERQQKMKKQSKRY